MSEDSLLCCDHVIEFGSPVRNSICHAAAGLCPLFYLGLSRNSKHISQISAKSKNIDFQSALRATVLKIQPPASVHISFSRRLGQIWLKADDFEFFSIECSVGGRRRPDDGFSVRTTFSLWLQILNTEGAWEGGVRRLSALL